MIYLQLLISFLQIGLFSFGGGYACMPLIQQQVVDIHHWLSMSEFIDLITISQMTPGPIVVNSATFVGIKIAGFPGVLVTAVGCIIPSCIISLILAHIYYKYKNISIMQHVLSCLRPAVVALIASAGISILALVIWDEAAVTVNNINWLSTLIFVIGFIILRKFHSNPIIVMVVSGISYLVLNLIFII